MKIRLVMFEVIADQIIQCKTIMAGNIVNTAIWITMDFLIDVRATQNACHQRFDRIIIAPDKAANVIPKRTVPLRKPIAFPHEPSDLIETGRIPGFCYQLGTGKHRIRLNHPEYRRSIKGGAIYISG